MDKYLTYTKVAFALHHLMSIPDCLFIATNTDETLPTDFGVLPGKFVCLFVKSLFSRMRKRLDCKDAGDLLWKTANRLWETADEFSRFSHRRV
jgi:hypothetical protein